MPQKLQITKEALQDPSLRSLIASNLITMILALAQGWSVLVVMWVYWFQSVIIGLFNFLRILSLKDFSTENFKMNDRPVEPTQSTKRSVAFFFLFHYGFFHFIYMIFLGSFSSMSGTGFLSPIKPVGPNDMFFISIGAIIFLINHLFSYQYNRLRDDRKPNIGELMFYPYARIIPMHLTIIFGFLLGNAGIILFLILKTAADAAMHIIEHQIFRKEKINPSVINNIN